MWSLRRLDAIEMAARGMEGAGIGEKGEANHGVKVRGCFQEV